MQVRDQIILLLQSKASDESKSSFWKTHLSDFRVIDREARGIPLIGERSPVFPFSSQLHKFCQRKSYPDLNIDFDSAFYKAAVSVATFQKRSVDFDLLKHVLSLEAIFGTTGEEKLNCCCVIGDGQSNFSSLALSSNKFNKTISINLPEVLLNDWSLLSHLCQEDAASVCRTSNDVSNFLQDKNKRFAMIQAGESAIIDSCNIDLFFNMASMQEMDPSAIESYFELIRSSSAAQVYFYCCNRVEKVLPDGTLIKFSDYPWDPQSEILFNEECPWYTHNYSLFRKRVLPFPNLFIPFDGPIQHRLMLKKQ